MDDLLYNAKYFISSHKPLQSLDLCIYSSIHTKKKYLTRKLAYCKVPAYSLIVPVRQGVPHTLLCRLTAHPAYRITRYANTKKASKPMATTIEKTTIETKTAFKSVDDARIWLTNNKTSIDAMLKTQSERLIIVHGMVMAILDDMKAISGTDARCDDAKSVIEALYTALRGPFGVGFKQVYTSVRSWHTNHRDEVPETFACYKARYNKSHKKDSNAKTTAEKIAAAREAGRNDTVNAFPVLRDVIEVLQAAERKGEIDRAMAELRDACKVLSVDLAKMPDLPRTLEPTTGK